MNNVYVAFFAFCQIFDLKRGVALNINIYTYGDLQLFREKTHTISGSN